MDMTEAESIINELLDASNNMLEITGGSEVWDGETHIALKKIEKAVYRANQMMSIANQGGKRGVGECQE